MRHIVAVSGGKDSTALALYLKPTIEAEYVFCDTGRELPEVYEFLERLECLLGQAIVKLDGSPIKETKRPTTKGAPAFDQWLEAFDMYLPSPQNRWCTKHLKIRPFERYIGKDEATVYIAIRADEDRVGNYGDRPNITYKYPLIEDGIDLRGVRKILKDAGVELPGFYSYRSVGGCWCCPFQRRSDWHGLKRKHPQLFQRAKAEEEKSGFRWNQQYALSEIEAQMDLPMVVEERNPDEWEDQMPCTICAK